MTTTTTMACANCGNGLFRITIPNDPQADTELKAECGNCGSVSTISFKPVQIDIKCSVRVECEPAPEPEQAPVPPPPAPRCQDFSHDWEPDGTTGGVKCTKCGESIPF